MTDQLRLDLHHVRSLERLMGTRDEGNRRWVGGRMEALLDDLFPLETRHGTVEIGEVDWMGWHGPCFMNDWKQPKKRPKWVRALEFYVSVNDSEFEGDEEDGPQPKAWLPLLWPIDETAMRDRDHFVYPEVRLSRASLMDGRPLVPLSQRSYRPGLHIIRHNSTVGRRLVLVPDAGPRLLITPKKVGKNWLYQVKFPGMRDRGRPLTAELTLEESSDLKNLLEFFEYFVGRKDPPAAYFSRATTEQVREKIQANPGDSELDHYVQLLQKLSRDKSESLPDFDYELSDDVLETRQYGELFARVVLESVLAAVRRFDALRDDDSSLKPRNEADPDFAKAVELAKRINAEYHRRYRHMLNGGKQGGTRYPALVIGADDRNTLGDLEQRRKVTRYSDEIGTDTSHWLWTRGIDSTRDRNRLCALQTPESEDIGYIRFLALGAYQGIPEDMQDMRDLSAAASLIPFLNHNDPARSSIGSKNLKQAVPIKGAEGPRVRSGTERLIAEAHGVARVPETIDVGGTQIRIQDAKVTDVHHDRVVAKAGDKEFCVLFGPPGPTGYWVDGGWKPTVNPGDEIGAGDIVAHAPDVVLPDVVLEDDQPVLALGADVLVAYTPWHGMNYEDAVVVSKAIVDRFTSAHVLSIREPCSKEELGHPLVEKERKVKKGEPLARVLSLTGEKRRTVRAPEDGVVDFVDTRDPEEITIRLRTHRPLAVGDKLTNRHGGKCVVSQILNKDEMPKLPDGRPVEMLLNPIGVIRRLNVGQLLEAHVSLCDYLTRQPEPRTVGRLFGPEERSALAQDLAEKGAPGGRLPLTCADKTDKDKTVLLDRHGGVVVGWQYMIKLDHLAIDKRNERRSIVDLVDGVGRDLVSARDRQPSKGRRWHRGERRGGAMRTGEMEIWALLATGMDDFLAETLAERSNLFRRGNSTLDSVKAHLAVGQIGIDVDGGEIRLLDSRKTEPLPGKPVDWLKELRSREARGATPDRESDALYAEIHGRHDHVVSCFCGDETQSGALCKACGDFAGRRPSPDRAKVRYHIELDAPVPHPWFRLRQREASREKGPSEPLPPEAHDKPRRRRLAKQAAEGAGFKATTGLSFDDGWWLTFYGTEARVCEPGGAPKAVPIAGTPVSGVADIDVDRGRMRAFLLRPKARGPEVTEIDLKKGEFVRNWAAVHREDARHAKVLMLSERGWPVLWGDGVGRLECVPMLHAIPILPPAYRVFDRDVLDRRYRDLARAVYLASTARDGAGKVSGAVWDLLGGRRDEPDAQTISGRLNSKMGMVRRNLRGRHNNSVARSVIAPDTSLRLEQVGLPAVTMEELGLRDNGKDVVVINRQPTLRPSNMVALKARRHKGNHIALHPLMSKQLAGDFDGDEVTVHCPVLGTAAKQAWERLRPTAGLLSDADGSAIMEADLDVALGLHLLPQAENGLKRLEGLLGLDIPARLIELLGTDTKALNRILELADTNFRVRNRLKDLIGELLQERATDPNARRILEALDGPDTKLRSRILDLFMEESDVRDRVTALFEEFFLQIFKSDTCAHETIPAPLIKLLIEDWYKRMSRDKTPDAPTRIWELYELATDVCTGWSASLLDLYRLNEEQFEELTRGQVSANSERAPGEHPDGANTVSWPQWLVEALGAEVAGKHAGLEQLLVKRGSHRTFSGNEHSAVSGCFLDGLESDDLFKTAPAALTTLAHKKLVTPLAGDLTKRLADAMYGVTVTAADCEVEFENRTPLDCREPIGCCAACIGELPSGRTPAEGERIGLLAAMLIGERCTQRAMKTFQSGGTNEAVDDTVNELGAAFGEPGRSLGHLTFKDAVKADQLYGLASQVARSLDVDERLVGLVLRQLLRYKDEKRPLQAARLTDDPLVDASTLGRLSVLLDAIGQGGSRAVGLQARQVYHLSGTRRSPTWQQR